MTWMEIGLLVATVVGWSVAVSLLIVNRSTRAEFLMFDDLMDESDKLFIRRANSLMRKIEAADAYHSTVGDLPANVRGALEKELTALVDADGAD